MKIDPMSLNNLEEVLSWAAAEGWNPGLDDAAAFFATHPDGFLVASDGDKSVAGISVVKYGDKQSFLGLYICHPDYRGQGIGLRLWNAGMQSLDGYTVGLDGVVAQQNNYSKSGFELAYRNIRYCGQASNLFRLLQREKTSSGDCREIAATDFPDILKMDYAVHGFDRSGLLNHWLINTKNRISFMHTKEGKLSGFGTIRQCLSGSKIGPLIANDKTVALEILAALMTTTDVQEIMLDVPEPNEVAMNLAKSMALTPIFETARMYSGSAPHYKLDKLFGVTTFELG